MKTITFLTFLQQGTSVLPTSVISTLLAVALLSLEPQGEGQ